MMRLALQLPKKPQYTTITPTELSLNQLSSKHLGHPNTPRKPPGGLNHIRSSLFHR